MKTLFDFCPADLDQLARHFKPWCDWNPYYTSTKCWFEYWGCPKGSVFWLNQGLNTHLDHIELTCEPLDNFMILRSGQPDELILTHQAAQLVGRTPIRNGRLTVDADLCLDDEDSDEFTKAIWFLSETRKETRKCHADFGKETILPEWDAFETNTPGHKGEMSSSIITQYDPFRAHGIRKRPMNDYKGRQEFVSTFLNGWVWTNFGGLTYRCPITRFYPILWVAVCGHQEAKGMSARVKIYNIKMEEF